MLTDKETIVSQFNAQCFFPCLVVHKIMVS